MANPGDVEPLAGARLFCSGSAALPPADFATFERLTGHRILERYGMSETLITLGNPLRGAREPGTVGFPFEGTRIRVVDEAGAAVAPGSLGELQVQTSGMLEGYWGQPEATAEAFTDGWFKTGDTVAQHPDGRVRIVGRTSTDILKVGGYKLSALEIEAAITQLPQVAECAVVGVPDAEWGQQVVACVVLREGATLALAQLQQALHLHEAKKPRRLVLLQALPRNALGKVQKKALLTSLGAAG
jgi:acyl-coenzyme A synthetase/AMP-(fatty) acid ligase